MVKGYRVVGFGVSSALGCVELLVFQFVGFACTKGPKPPTSRRFVCRPGVASVP